MLALIASSKPGGDSGPAVFYTVPWSPLIAERGQMPGKIILRMLSLFACMKDDAALIEFNTATDQELFITGLLASASLGCAASTLILRTMLRDLGFL